ncbi:hypothetical protein JJB11_21450 [Ramlibacter ginsenosidimutans]|uniref:Uncharacterized protein n=1 Tax=Ramlibacter ginsenosidimutans TaxID=502333 RepID=A0A934WPT1_9BURK|nr:hypothetical protein [Ramlibacter ginsenosidimutans]MBK6008675.1 hypothetical protein [Ramlibacter ginsenosidimutans]
MFIWWSLLKPIESRQKDPNLSDRRAPGVWLRALQWLGQRRVGWPGHLLRGLVAALVGGTVTAVSTIVGTFMMFLALVMISLLPYIGYVGGAAYANATVMAPQACVSSPGKRLRARSMGAPGANCVEIVDPVSKQKYVGRLVAATGTKIVLYLPSVDQVVAIPRKTEVILTTESAPSPAAGARK